MRALTMDGPELGIRPDLDSPGELPAHARISAWLERLILSRKLLPGDKLPAEVEIANVLGVSRMTLRQALAAIEAKGLIDRRRGRFGGNFVEAPRFDLDHASLPGFTEQMRLLDVQAGAQVIRASTGRPDAAVRQALSLKRGEQVHEVLRVRSANGEPLVFEEGHFPAGTFPDLLARDLTGSLYAVMRDYGAGPFAAEEQIEAISATAEQADLLDVAVGQPLLLITRTSRSADGTPVEFARDYHRADRTRIRVRSTAR